MTLKITVKTNFEIILFIIMANAVNIKTVASVIELQLEINFIFIFVLVFGFLLNSNDCQCQCQCYCYCHFSLA